MTRIRLAPLRRCVPLWDCQNRREMNIEEQITYALRQAEGGTPVSDVCRQLGVSEATFYV